jgi:hypothetical protein
MSFACALWVAVAGTAAALATESFPVFGLPPFFFFLINFI